MYFTSNLGIDVKTEKNFFYFYPKPTTTRFKYITIHTFRIYKNESDGKKKRKKYIIYVLCTSYCITVGLEIKSKRIFGERDERNTFRGFHSHLT